MKSLIPLSLVVLAIGLPTLALATDDAAPSTLLHFDAPQVFDVPGADKLEGPSFFDYDRDGVTDLISGNYAGNVIFRKNIGKNAKPRYAKPIKLKHADGSIIAVQHW